MQLLHQLLRNCCFNYCKMILTATLQLLHQLLQLVLTATLQLHGIDCNQHCNCCITAAGIDCNTACNTCINYCKLVLTATLQPLHQLTVCICNRCRFLAIVLTLTLTFLIGACLSTTARKIDFQYSHLSSMESKISITLHGEFSRSATNSSTLHFLKNLILPTLASHFSHLLQYTP